MDGITFLTYGNDSSRKTISRDTGTLWILWRLQRRGTKRGGRFWVVRTLNHSVRDLSHYGAVKPNVYTTLHMGTLANKKAMDLDVRRFDLASLHISYVSCRPAKYQTPFLHVLQRLLGTLTRRIGGRKC